MEKNPRSSPGAENALNAGYVPMRRKPFETTMPESESVPVTGSADRTQLGTVKVPEAPLAVHPNVPVTCPAVLPELPVVDVPMIAT